MIFNYFTEYKKRIHFIFILLLWILSISSPGIGTLKSEKMLFFFLFFVLGYQERLLLNISSFIWLVVWIFCWDCFFDSYRIYCLHKYSWPRFSGCLSILCPFCISLWLPSLPQLGSVVTREWEKKLASGIVRRCYSYKHHWSVTNNNYIVIIIQVLWIDSQYLNLEIDY
jgi:hypothetical protein